MSTDAAGNSSSDQTNAELTIDTTNPAVPTVDILVTNSATPTLTGTFTEGDQLSVEVNAVTYVLGVDAALTSDGRGGWSLLLPSTSDGVYEVVVTDTDSANNSEVDVTNNELTIDTVAPLIPTVDSLTTNDANPTLTGSADPDEVLTVQVNGVTYRSDTVGGPLQLNPDGSWSLDLSSADALIDGVYEVIAESTDAAGNSSSDDSNNELLVDITPPMVTVTEYRTNDSTPVLTGTIDLTGSALDFFTVQVNGVTYDSRDDSSLVQCRFISHSPMPYGNLIYPRSRPCLMLIMILWSRRPTSLATWQSMPPLMS